MIKMHFIADTNTLLPINQMSFCLDPKLRPSVNQPAAHLGTILACEIAAAEAEADERTEVVPHENVGRSVAASVARSLARSLFRRRFRIIAVFLMTPLGKSGGTRGKVCDIPRATDRRTDNVPARPGGAVSPYR